MTFLTCSRYGIHLLDGRFYGEADKLGDWFHVVLNFIGPSDGIRIYHKGVKVISDASKNEGNYTEGDKRIVIGRHFSRSDERYASIQMDELLFFNEALTEDEIILLGECNTSEVLNSVVKDTDVYTPH